MFADFNKTHATNPKWTPHARFHVVWQISSYVGFGLLAFALIWWPGPLVVERLYLAALMSAIIFIGAFFVALIAMPVYGGASLPTRTATSMHAPIPLIGNEKMGRQHHHLLRSGGAAGDGHQGGSGNKIRLS